MERVGVYAAGISVAVGVHYPRRPVELPRARGAVIMGRVKPPSSLAIA